MSRYRPHRSLGLRALVRHLHRWARRHFCDRKHHGQQKITDAMLIALQLTRLFYKHPYASIWWAFLQEVRHTLPSYTQAYTRTARLLPFLEALATPGERLCTVLIDSEPLPVCHDKRAKRCKFKEAAWGYGTQGDFYGFKLHAWVSKTGEVVQYVIRLANFHDVTIAYELNRRWPEFGGPKIVGDNSYTCLGFVTPPKKNAKHDTGWDEKLHGPMRKRIETVFSQFAQQHIRWGQVKTQRALRLRVVLTVLAHNLSLQA